MKAKLFLVLLFAMFALPAHAVLNEKNISRTISVLRHELHATRTEMADQDRRHEKASQMEEVHQREMLGTIKWINELTLILYSQKNGFTLDQTYAADCVIYEYRKFSNHKRPKFTNIAVIDEEIGRYQSLIDALKLLPPQLDRNEAESFSALMDSLMTTIPVKGNQMDTLHKKDEKISLIKELATYGRSARMEVNEEADNSSILLLSKEAQVDRDSCISYAEAIVQSYTKQKEKIKQEEHYVSEVRNKLQQTYEYANSCFDDIKNYIFVAGQESYFSVLANFRRYVRDAACDMDQQYGTGDTEQDIEGLRESQWRGVVLASTILYSLSHLLLISLIVILLFCVILRKFKPFNTQWFKQTKPAVLILTIAVAYSLLIVISGMMFPMSNFIFIAATRVLIYLWFVIALVLSLLVGMKSEDVRMGLASYAPILTMGLLLMLFRAIFLPDKMIHILLSPLLVIFIIWQIQVIRKHKTGMAAYKNMARLQNVTVIVFGTALLVALRGFSLLAMMFLMWWIFQGATLATLASIKYILLYYEKKGLAKRKEQYAATHKMVSNDKDGDFIKVTWLYDLVYRAFLPITCILSVLGCIWLALGVFNLAEFSQTIFHKPFFDFTGSDGQPILQVSFFKLVTVCASFFLYRYLNYLVRSLYRTNKFEKMLKVSGKAILKKNDVNLTLAYNVIGIIIWGLYIILCINILKIPIGAISIIAAGLATGLGLALKDVLNNFIYGIQLMSGRLRVGDILECDGIRGTVEKISYQSTEIQTISGAVISFTNSTLFNKNFQNLTKNSPYEYVTIIVSISYGEDVEKVRTLLVESLKEYTARKDKYGRHLIDQKTGVWVTFDSFGDSSVNLAIKQHVLVESKFAYMAEVRERVYKLFNDNKIVIPFPQQEVSILNFPEKDSAK